MNSTGKRISAAVLAAAVGFASLSALAGEADVKHRQNAMKAIAAHMGAIGAVVKGEVDDMEGLKHHAAALADTAEAAGTVFGENAMGGNALPAIWSDTDGFQEAYSNFAGATANLAEVAQGGDAAAIQEAFGGVGQTCGGCHRTYRAKN